MDKKINKTSNSNNDSKIQIDKVKKDIVKKAQPKKDIVKKDEPKKINKEKVSSNFLNIKINTQAIFDTILSERNSQRQGTHKVKNRSEVRGGGKKPFAQKHTGRARAGTIRSPIWVGGGTVFGPNPERNYKLKVNKKIRKLAFLSSISLKAKEEAIIIDEIKMNKISTKELVKNIEKLQLKKSFKKVLIISESEILFKSANNLPNIKVQKLSGLHIEQIVNSNVMIISKNDITKIEGMVK